MVIEIKGILCDSYLINNEKYYFWRLDTEKKLCKMSTSIDIYLLITAGKFDKKIEEMMIRRIGNIGVCGILKENTVDPKNNLLPADFTKVLFQMEIRATDEVYFVKGVDFDYTYASANDHGMQIDWCDYLKDNVPNVLRMGDYYRSFTL